ncbi:hypothetical protein SKAU_G00343600 [Synaphobranchus kaupii]|uniref:Uncharacterized protein n=1 Tax=Synaphobranchus kaupii TaxID=118154 RepID=A0A9Q1EJ44_SYNKA|nr:hypothetical protein SKAU_G00343600 [Synaphobranchus kaupii]
MLSIFCSSSVTCLRPHVLSDPNIYRVSLVNSKQHCPDTYCLMTLDISRQQRQMRHCYCY